MIYFIGSIIAFVLLMAFVVMVEDEFKMKYLVAIVFGSAIWPVTATFAFISSIAWLADGEDGAGDVVLFKRKKDA